MPRRPRNVGLVALLSLLGVLAALIGAWAIDTAVHSGQAMRNVRLAGVPVGDLSETEVRAVVEQLAGSSTSRPVHVSTPAGSLDTTAAELGLAVDREATVQAVLDAGRGNVLSRPFEWLGSLFSDHRVHVVYRLDLSQTTTTLAALDAANRIAPVEPTLEVRDGELTAVPGSPGVALDLDTVESQLVAGMATPEDPVIVELETKPVVPTYTDDDAQRVASEARQLTARPLTIHVAGSSATVEPGTLQTWVRAVPTPDGSALTLGMDEELISRDVSAAVGQVGKPPVELTWHVDGAGNVSFTEGSPGTACCTEDSPRRIIDALRAGQDEVQLELTVKQPEHDAEWARRMGITTVVGTFTTNHAAGESRVSNIHRIADLIRGVVIEPGETFSVNEYVGQRTRAKGFVEAGVLYSGKFTTDVGGGVSQFATTLFNAAFFAGLDLVEYQAHTIYISRYPYGREATLSYPKPDLKIRNNTPYGVLIWPTYTNSSITVTLYSTPWVKGEQTGQTRTPSGACTKVTTERTRTYLRDGRREVDTVTALYQPAEGVLC
ncbi:MAG: VanW family protein [Acidimicrobiales bacterium]